MTGVTPATIITKTDYHIIMIRIEHKTIEVTYISDNDLYFTNQSEIDIFPTHVIIGDDIFFVTKQDDTLVYTKSGMPALRALRYLSNIDYNYTTLTLSSVLSSSGATASYRYGYPSYITEYRSSSGSSLSSSTTYGNFYVTERIDADVSSVEYDLYLLILILVIIQGSMMIFSWLRVAKN